MDCVSSAENVSIDDPHTEDDSMDGSPIGSLDDVSIEEPPMLPDGWVAQHPGQPLKEEQPEPLAIDTAGIIQAGRKKRFEDISHGMFSKKVFVGGLPFDVTEPDIITSFSKYGPMSLDWPRKNECEKVVSGSKQSHGYVFLIFSEKDSVTTLLNACFRDRDRFFLEFKTRSVCKSVQIRPWSEKDSYFVPKFIEGKLVTTLRPRNTIFIGGVPRPTRAEDLAKIVENAFGKIVYASIDTDPELGYPKGAARLVFHRRDDYVRAMTEKYVDLNHCGARKRLEVKPYIIEEQKCDVCGGANSSELPANYFCAGAPCLRYYCEFCWDYVHYTKERVAAFGCHLPYVRNGESTRQLNNVPHHRAYHGH